MELQQQQLDDLATWLTQMEDRIHKQEPVGADLESIKRQVEDHKVCTLLRLLPFVIWNCSSSSSSSRIELIEPEPYEAIDSGK